MFGGRIGKRRSEMCHCRYSVPESKKRVQCFMSKGRGFVLEGCFAWLAGNSVAGN